MLQNADYATEMVLRKHPYETGLPAREGIEF
ncbi:MAG: cob(I)yrinic acid a,c-diamide adenosyltransferase [Ruthenibacterium sp.]